MPERAPTTPNASRLLASAAILVTLASITLVSMALVALAESGPALAASFALLAAPAVTLTLALRLAQRRHQA